MTLILLLQGVGSTPIAASDSFGFSEAAAVSVATGAAETFAFIEARSIAAALEIADAVYVLAETPTIAAQVGVADSLAHSDGVATVLETLAKAGSDSGAFTDAAALSAAVNVADALSHSEIAAIAAQLAAADTFAWADAASVLTFEDKAGSDSLTQGDNATIAAQVAAAEVVAFTDASASIMATLAASETHTHSDNALAGEFAEKAGNDALTHSELASLANALAASDSMAIADSISSLSAALAVSDPHAMTEAVAIAAQLGALDNLTFSEATALLQTNTVSASDAITFMESVALANALGATDALSLSEMATVDILVLKAALDNLVFTDAASVIQGVPAPALKLPLTAAIVMRAATASIVKRLAAAAVAARAAVVGNLADVTLPPANTADAAIEPNAADADVPYNGA